MRLTHRRQNASFASQFTRHWGTYTPADSLEDIKCPEKLRVLYNEFRKKDAGRKFSTARDPLRELGKHELCRVIGNGCVTLLLAQWKTEKKMAHGMDFTAD